MLVVAVHNDSGNVLSRESLLASLRYQQSLRQNRTVNSTLADERAMVGIENLVAAAALRDQRTTESGTVQNGSSAGLSAEFPPLSAQIDTLESMSDGEVERVVERLLAPGPADRAAPSAYDFLPTHYEPGATETDGRLTVVRFETDGVVVSVPELSDTVRESQVAAATLAEDVPRDQYRPSGAGLLLVEEEESIGESFGLVGPIALLFVLVTLLVAYRDVLDLVLGLVGVVLTLVWTFGAMGWLGIDFSLLMIVTPVLLIGLSIDYCIHVVMRYREERSGETAGGPKPVRTAMHDGLSGLGPALVLVTVTAIIGFLSIVTNGVPAMTDFAVTTAVGLIGSLLVFAGFVPALKAELDGWLAARGYDRERRAFGTTGWLRRALAGVARGSSRHAGWILLAALLVSSLGIAAGTQVETQFTTEDYIAEDAPAWADELPEPLRPSEYDLRETRAFIFANFQSPDQRVDIVVDGNVTAPTALDGVAASERAAADRTVTFRGPTGDPAVSGPVAAMQAVARTDDAFATRLSQADVDDDGVPDQNLAAVYDQFYRAAPDRAARYLHRTDDGSYDALRVAITVDGTAEATEIAGEMRDVATFAETDETTVTVAGRPILNELTQRQLATATARGLGVALVTVLVVLVGAFWYRQGSPSLGAVTLVPVVMGISWILGGMYLVGLPFSFATALIGSIAIGLGVDYAIHVSERYGHELDNHGDVDRALEASVVGTGGALLGSAVTTAGGFGVLAFALVPTMQQFGVITALTLVFAFVASVLVLPSMLVLWTRHVRGV
jgi:predicted RND superfamily exporter protein